METKEFICVNVKRKNLGAESFDTLKVESAVLKESWSRNRGGILYTQTLDIKADIDSDIANDMQRNTQTFELTTDKGKTITWGDDQFVTRCNSCTRENDETEISFKRLATSAVF